MQDSWKMNYFALIANTTSNINSVLSTSCSVRSVSTAVYKISFAKSKASNNKKKSDIHNLIHTAHSNKPLVSIN